MRELLQKSDLPHGTREKVQRAAESCEREYLLKHSIGAANAMASRARERGEERLTPPRVI
jgi:predicted hydrolase (HD superfamily)